MREWLVLMVALLVHSTRPSSRFIQSLDTLIQNYMEINISYLLASDIKCRIMHVYEFMVESLISGMLF